MDQINIASFAIHKERRALKARIAEHNREYNRCMNKLDVTRRANFRVLLADRYPKVVPPKDKSGGKKNKKLMAYRRRVQTLKAIHFEECLTEEENDEYSYCKKMIIDDKFVSTLRILRREINKQLIKGNVNDRMYGKMLLLEIEYILKKEKDDLTKKISNLTKIKNGIANQTPNSVSLEEVGRMFGVTRQAIQLIENSVMKKLKRPANKRILQQWQEFNPSFSKSH